jgi:hypothetical protein
VFFSFLLLHPAACECSYSESGLGPAVQNLSTSSRLSRSPLCSVSSSCSLPFLLFLLHDAVCSGGKCSQCCSVSLSALGDGIHTVGAQAQSRETKSSECDATDENADGNICDILYADEQFRSSRDKLKLRNNEFTWSFCLLSVCTAWLLPLQKALFAIC